MARLLVIDDDLAQLQLRKAIFENAGHEVSTAPDVAQALAAFSASPPDLVLTDLRLPETVHGLALIRRLRELSSTVRIVVLSGLPGDLDGTPEEKLVDQILGKPIRTQDLIRLIGQLTLWFVCLFAVRLFAATELRVNLSQPSEVVGEIEMSAPGSDWFMPGREAAVASLTVDGKQTQHIILYAGNERRTYGFFAGLQAAGEHRIRVDRDPVHSPAASDLKIHSVRLRPPGEIEVAHAPILYARRNTIGRFSDVPLLMYCERLVESGQPVLQYTVVFSNEDGGTSTRALMARWGRTTDIEYIYRVWPMTGRAIIQGRNHKDLEFTGPYEGKHPLLIPVTDNNMVAGEGPSDLRFQIAPVVVNLDNHSREQVMDDDPTTYRVASVELEREGKLRAHGVVDGEKISDPRNYLYIEAKISNENSRLAAVAGADGKWMSSNLGRPDYAVERSGWVRTTIEWPPATPIRQLGFQCLTADKAHSGVCRVLEVSKVFYLDSDYRPGRNLLRISEPREIPTGQMVTWSLESK
jgi:CheY-like chemotaxis protein